MTCFNNPSWVSAGTGTAPRNNNTKPVPPIASLESVSMALDAVFFQRRGLPSSFVLSGAPARSQRRVMYPPRSPQSQEANAKAKARSELLSMIDEALWIVEDSGLEDLLGNHTHTGPSYDRSNQDGPLRD
mmetsp:Transcript_29662/g.69800  ORF Transcript_29662/g.69800 Transcript_29662/m.69800 type:complete len:130 (-) Transcript_29662:204-593(-)|eukprot:CAMPEP_0172382928 /NCGR_PEP_ID=MMETSP1061-20121228/880_1 /TAXON_ID=37318 /ORGANISM="Pseudo-nitzschia pungens, Strain cf. pungens" /LENGTH=129 /DNA_ID=CAMNT_0013111007 /DNA_START=6 /DNA_END=395 /DNA_ORIENTATION=+